MYVRGFPPHWTPSVVAFQNLERVSRGCRRLGSQAGVSFGEPILHFSWRFWYRGL